jgi:hypothetical protein
MRCPLVRELAVDGIPVTVICQAAPTVPQRHPNGTPNGIRTRAATLKGWCPRPLDDGGLYCLHSCRCVVGLPGFEPGTSASRTQRATKLRYSPQRVPPQRDNPSRRTGHEPKN